MEGLQQRGVVAGGISLELLEREGHGTDARGELSRLDLFHGLIVLRPPDRAELHDIARIEQDEVAQIPNGALRIVDRHGRDAEHLIAARAADRVDATKTTTVPDGEPGRVGART